jgi:hypothetical protein
VSQLKKLTAINVTSVDLDYSLSPRQSNYLKISIESKSKTTPDELVQSDNGASNSGGPFPSINVGYKDSRLPENIPEDCPKIVLGGDFYSLALYAFYFNDNEEKDGLQLDTDFDINKIVKQK